MSSPLFFERFGAGPPLVALHGFGLSNYTWHALRPTLAARRTVYACDLKGHGRSPRPADGRYSVHDQAAMVLATMDAERLDGVTLLGHSFGGGVALTLALELIQSAPGRVRALVLLNAASYRQPVPPFMRGLRLPILGAVIHHAIPVSVQVRTVMKHAYYRDELIPQASIEAYTAALSQPGVRRAVRAGARQIIPPDVDALSARFPSITVPTLIIWGRHDRIVPLSIGERLARAIPHSTFLVIDDAGHIPHEETPDPVCRALADFLDQVRPGGVGPGSDHGLTPV